MVEFECVITNGYVDIDTMEYYLNKGYIFVCTIPAKLIHPHAIDTDKASIFSRYKEYPIIGVEGCNKTCEGH